MTAAQFKAALKRLALTQGEVAFLFDVEPRTVRRWAANGCSGPPAILLYLMAKGVLPIGLVIAAAKAVRAR
jgi:transcriptional regulator with XRE-family HTH domain